MVFYFRLDLAVDDATERRSPKAVPDAKSMVRVFPDAQAAWSVRLGGPPWGRQGHPDSGRDEGSSLLFAKADWRLLDLEDSEAVSNLAALIDRHHLYRLSMELILDEAFERSEHDKSLRAALDDALQPPLNRRIWQEPVDKHEKTQILQIPEGELKYPFLGDLDHEGIARLYSNVLRRLPSDQVQHDYGLNRLTRMNRTMLYADYDGFACADTAYIRFDKLVAVASRPDHTPMVLLEDYIQRGTERAEQSGCQTAMEHLQAFVTADHFQLARCHEIHVVLAAGSETPEWIRADIFHVLEHEAIKQYHAKALLADPDGMLLVAGMPMLRRAIQTNAAGDVSDMLQLLLRETLSGTGYAGAAGIFAERAQARAEEWRLNAASLGRELT